MQQKGDKERREGANLALLEKSKPFSPSDDGNLCLFFLFSILEIYLQKCLCARRNLIEASPQPQSFLLKLHFPSCPAGHVDRRD